ncbi:MAG TPA: HAMP domain-containing sensor histidine kinase [Vicinamibacterales bacterium]|nr:HAMP domain-containing sensor histidine kinase [Vicinamibacterales bacterium]
MSNAPGDVELSRLLSLTAHEIRNPLSPLQGFMQFVLKDKKNEISAQQREWLQTSMNCAGRLHELANQLSDYAKLVKGEVTLSRKPTQVDTLLRDVIAALPPDKERGVAVELSGEGKARIIQGDPLHLSKAFTWIFRALRLEVGQSGKLYVVVDEGDYQGKPANWVLVGDEDQLNVLRQQPRNALGWFDNKERGNLGVTLWIAEWILKAHDGGIWAPPSVPKGGGALVALPTLK